MSKRFSSLDQISDPQLTFHEVHYELRRLIERFGYFLIQVPFAEEIKSYHFQLHLLSETTRFIIKRDKQS